MLPRKIFCGQQVDATIGFFDDNGVPRVPIDNGYPVFTVLDCDSNFVTTGVGTLSEYDHLWHGEFVVPSMAKISTDTSKYVITWVFVDVQAREYTSSEYFDVTTDYDVFSKETQLLGIAGSDFTAYAPFASNDDVKVHLYQGDNKIDCSYPEVEGVYADYYLFKLTICRRVLNAGEYGLVWTQGSYQFYQKLVVIPLSGMAKLSDLRMYLDKVHKDINLYLGYRDSDLWFHVNRGLSIINSIPPITNWTTASFTGSISMFAFAFDAAALWSALNAQYLAEGDSAFDYSGQPVQLSVDRTQYIESEIGRLWDYLQSEFKEAKKQLIYLDAPMHLGLSWPSVAGYQGLDQRHLGVPLRQLIR